LGDNSVGKSISRKDFIQTFGLSEIEDLRTKMTGREGLLIDYDYATILALEEESEGKEDIEGSQDEKTEEQAHPAQPSGGRTVRFFFDVCLYMLRHPTGYSPFYCNGVTSLWDPPSCCA
jgi:hypothetical protein